MTDLVARTADRYRLVADQFTARVDQVAAGDWDNPAPCEGWVARDVVAHLVEWLPAFFFERWPVPYEPGPAVVDDPAGAWHAVDRAIRAAFDDPSIAGAEQDTPMGLSTFAAAVDAICTDDLLVHTWDIARATGLDERLDAGQVHRYVEAMEPFDAAMRASEHFGPRVDVPADADEQTRMLAFTGRRP